MAEVEFEVITSEEIKYAEDKKFIEVARKKAKTEEGENEFISISSGYFTPTGEKRFKKSFTVPNDAEVIDFIAENLKKM